MRTISSTITVNVGESSTWTDGESEVAWEIAPGGELKVSSTGGTVDFGSANVPWSAYKSSITTVVIDDSVTYSYVSDDMFYNMGDFPVIAGNVSFSINTNANSSGFINPEYKLVYDKEGNISDVEIHYGEAYDHQMLRYGKL